MKDYTIGKNEAGQRFDKYLARILPAAPKSFLYKMLRKKNITLNGKKARGNELLAVSDRVVFYLSDETFDKFSRAGIRSAPAAIPRTYDLPSAVIYEDDDILILNKPAGILSQPDSSGAENLSDALIAWLLDEGKLTEDTLRTFRPAPVNRLDRNTTGLILCGMSLGGSQFLSAAIRRGEIRKHYLTVTGGPVRDGVYRAYLKKDTVKNRVTVSSRPADGYSEIITGVRVLDRSGEYSLLDVDLITGRTHQIRSHLAFLGAPVIGDTKYGDPKLCRTMAHDYGLRYQFLHARRLLFAGAEGRFSYLSGRTFTAPLSAEEERVLAGLDLHLPQTKEVPNQYES